MASSATSVAAAGGDPASTSEWPFRYLVAECITRSAPSCSGRQPIGVAIVLSTAILTPGRPGGGRQPGQVGHGRTSGFEIVSAKQQAGAVERALDRRLVGEVDEPRLRPPPAQQRERLAVQLLGGHHHRPRRRQQLQTPR